MKKQNEQPIDLLDTVPPDLIKHWEASMAQNLKGKTLADLRQESVKAKRIIRYNRRYGYLITALIIVAALATSIYSLLVTHESKLDEMIKCILFIVPVIVGTLINGIFSQVWDEFCICPNEHKVAMYTALVKSLDNDVRRLDITVGETEGLDTERPNRLTPDRILINIGQLAEDKIRNERECARIDGKTMSTQRIRLIINERDRCDAAFERAWETLANKFKNLFPSLSRDRLMGEIMRRFPLQT